MRRVPSPNMPVHRWGASELELRLLRRMADQTDQVDPADPKARIQAGGEGEHRHPRCICVNALEYLDVMGPRTEYASTSLGCT
jgi:hypothetical protein